MKWKDILCLDLSLMMIFGRYSLMQLNALTFFLNSVRFEKGGINLSELL